MVFKKQLKPGEFEVIKEGQEEVMRINYEGIPLFPSVEDNKEVMRDVIEKLTQAPGVSRILFYKTKVYSYDSEQTRVLMEISNVYNYINKQKIVSNKVFQEYSNVMANVLLNLFKEDPIGAYVELKRILREERINLKHEEYSSRRI